MANFLVIQAARLGDLCQSKRLIQSLAQKGTVHLAIDHSLLPLAQILYPQAILHGIIFHGKSNENVIAQNLSAFGQLQDIEFLQIYNCNLSGLAAAICRLFAEEQIVGYRPCHHSNGGVYKSAWNRLIFKITSTRAEAPLNLVDAWAHYTDNPITGPTVNPPARPGGKGIGVVVAGRAQRRSLPPEILANLLKIIFNFYESPEILIFGTNAEKPLARKIIRNLPATLAKKTNDLTGKTNLKQLPDALGGLDLLLTPDTGVMHLAAHLGVPVLAFFLSSAFCHETGPYGVGHHIWQSQTACLPCLESATCNKDRLCLQPFAASNFARLLIGGLKNDQNILNNCPPTLQLWQTDMDSLGQTLELQAGQDRHSIQRAAIRTIAGAWLKLPQFIKLLPNVPEGLMSRFFIQEDWMLPPQRYF